MKHCIWANLLHLSFNMWGDRRDLFSSDHYGLYQPHLRFDDRLWNDILERMAAVGMNMVVLDLGDGVRYESHPEIAVENAWSIGRLCRELEKMRRMGLEPIPKLNFSACHDNWLGPYARCVSTPAYYKVCTDLIGEVCALFGRPRFFHLGMDEETAMTQRINEYIVIRNGDLWWSDLNFLVKNVERHGSRAWVWADHHWSRPDEYEKKMPRSVVQGNWWYNNLDPRLVVKRCMPELGARELPAKPVDTYLRLARAGYDQIPTASNWSSDNNFTETALFARRYIPSRKLLGLLQTAWKPTLEEFRQVHMAAIDQVGEAIARWNGEAVYRPLENHGCCMTIPSKPGLRVGVYQANPGSGLIVGKLNEDKRLNAFVLPRLDSADLRQTEAVLITRAPSSYYFNRARSGLRRWVYNGGVLALMYDACGWNKFAPPLFPEIGLPTGKEKQITKMPRGISRRSWCDHLLLRKGRKGTVLLSDQIGQSLVIGGRYGRGKVLLIGMYVGEAFAGSKSPGGSPQEWRFLRGLLRPN